jgi:hypothetical protein
LGPGVAGVPVRARTLTSVIPNRANTTPFDVRFGVDPTRSYDGTRIP